MTTKTIGRMYVPIFTTRLSIFSVDEDDSNFMFLEFVEDEDIFAGLYQELTIVYYYRFSIAVFSP